MNLYTLEPKGRQRSYDLGSDIRYIVGRGDVQIPLNSDKTCSRHHAAVFKTNMQWVIEAAEGKSVQVDGEDVRASILYPGSPVRVGSSWISLDLPLLSDALKLEMPETSTGATPTLHLNASSQLYQSRPQGSSSPIPATFSRRKTRMKILALAIATLIIGIGIFATFLVGVGIGTVGTGDTPEETANAAPASVNRVDRQKENQSIASANTSDETGDDLESEVMDSGPMDSELDRVPDIELDRVPDIEASGNETTTNATPKVRESTDEQKDLHSTISQESAPEPKLDVQRPPLQRMELVPDSGSDPLEISLSAFQKNSSTRQERYAQKEGILRDTSLSMDERERKANEVIIPDLGKYVYVEVRVHSLEYHAWNGGYYWIFLYSNRSGSARYYKPGSRDFEPGLLEFGRILGLEQGDLKEPYGWSNEYGVPYIPASLAERLAKWDRITVQFVIGESDIEVKVRPDIILDVEDQQNVDESTDAEGTDQGSQIALPRNSDSADDLPGKESKFPLANWAQLDRLMTQKEVRKLLGEPSEVETRSTNTKWIYSFPCGEVNFYTKGPNAGKLKSLLKPWRKLREESPADDLWEILPRCDVRTRVSAGYEHVEGKSVIERYWVWETHKTHDGEQRIRVEKTRKVWKPAHDVLVQGYVIYQWNWIGEESAKLEVNEDGTIRSIDFPRE